MKTTQKTSKKLPTKKEPEVLTKSGRVLLGKYEVFPVNDSYAYRLKASNGEVIVVSETYKNIKSVEAAIQTVQKNIENGILQIYEDKHGKWQFKLFASNKRLLVSSANYTTSQRCNSAAESFKRFGVISPIVVLQEDPDNLFEKIEIKNTIQKSGGKIYINQLEDEFDFRLYANNGVVLCTSKEFATKKSIMAAISNFKEAIKTGIFYVVKDKNDMFQFKLYSQNGSRCIVIGEAYKNKNNAISSANSVAAFAGGAEVIDKTKS